MVAIRESELRSELLGYDVRLYKMLGFTVSAAVAGLAGCLFTAVNGYVGPSAFDLNQASQFLLWVIAGGLGTLAGPVIASFVFQYLQTYLGAGQIQHVAGVRRDHHPLRAADAARQRADAARWADPCRRRAGRQAQGLPGGGSSGGHEREPVLQTRDLTRRFGGVVAVNNVDLAIAEGELRCLIGPNGAGKSTLFKCMTHQLRPSSGEILLSGRNLAGYHPHQIARMGVAIKNQIPSVYGGLSVRENIWLAGRRAHRGRELERAVETSWRRSASTIPARRSKGRRAVACPSAMGRARHAAGDPSNACAARRTDRRHDAGRDAENRRAHQASEQRSTIIVVEHDLDFISLLAKRVTVLHRGAILVEDTMENVVRNEMVRDIYLGSQWRAKQ